MRKNYLTPLRLTLALLLASVFAFGQGPSDKHIIFVGQYVSGTTDIRPEDQVALDSIAKWASVEFMDSGDFNDASATDLYGEGGKNAVGVIISESIGSGGVGNFGLRDGYPVPAVVMEMGVFTNDQASETKWPLLTETGGIWGYEVPEAVDLQWKIADDMHYITEEHGIGDIVDYASNPDRGIPYLQGIEAWHIMLAMAARETGGVDNPTFVQDQAVAMAYLEDYEMVIMNVAYTYLAEGTPEFYAMLHRAVIFLFDAFPTGIHTVPAEEIGFSVFPNPAADHALLRFNADAGQELRVNLHSVTGALVGNVYQGISQSGENEIVLNTSPYVSGLYLVELTCGDKTSFTKFVLK